MHISVGLSMILRVLVRLVAYPDCPLFPSCGDFYFLLQSNWSILSITMQLFGSLSLQLQYPDWLTRLISVLSFDTYQPPSSPDYSPSCREVARINAAVDSPIYRLCNPFVLCVIVLFYLALSFVYTTFTLLFDGGLYHYLVPFIFLLSSATTAIYPNIDHLFLPHQYNLRDRAYFPNFFTSNSNYKISLDYDVSEPSLYTFHLISVLTSLLLIPRSIFLILAIDIPVLTAVLLLNILSVTSLFRLMIYDLFSKLDQNKSTQSFTSHYYHTAYSWLPQHSIDSFSVVFFMNQIIDRIYISSIIALNMPIRLFESLITPIVHIYGLCQPVQALQVRRNIDEHLFDSPRLTSNDQNHSVFSFDAI